MPLNFKLPKVALRRGGGSAAASGKFQGAMGEGLAGQRVRPDLLKPWKIAIGLLALGNLAAFFLLVKPVGGSAADLEAQRANLQMQIKRQQLSLRSARDLVGKVEGARAEHLRFMQTYFMDRRTMSSTILKEIKDSASAAGLAPKEHSFGFEPIEGTENLGMMTITANYEGTYGDLVKFVNLIDHSKRFLIIDNIQAAPQQQGAKLTSRFKINAFVRELPREVIAAEPAVSLDTAPREAAPAKAAVKQAPAAAPVKTAPVASDTAPKEPAPVKTTVTQATPPREAAPIKAVPTAPNTAPGETAPVKTTGTPAMPPREAAPAKAVPTAPNTAPGETAPVKTTVTPAMPPREAAPVRTPAAEPSAPAPTPPPATPPKTTGLPLLPGLPTPVKATATEVRQ